MEYDFTIPGNGGQIVDVQGKFFKYRSGTGKIRVTTEKGESVDLLPGQGVFNIDYTRLTIVDRTGNQNNGVLLAGNFDFRDDRISGTVDVIDGGKSRTLANQAFLGTGAIAAPATNFPYAQLFNPAASAVNLILKSFAVSSSVAGYADLRIYNAAFANVGTSFVTNKQIGGAVGNGVVNANYGATQISAAVVTSYQLQANSSLIVPLSEQIVIRPGYGLLLDMNNSTGLTLLADYEWYEEAR
jgi:hypothetical protein